MVSSVTILSDTVCELGEGPTYDASSDMLYWFDIVAKSLLEMPLSGGETRISKLPVMASALGVIDDQRQLLATEKGLYVRDVRTGALTLHTAIESDNDITRSNDARVHPSGAFWIGTMGKSAEKHAGAIYWFFKGEVRRLFPDITVPNAICFSSDGATAFFTDSVKGLLFRVDCDPRTGLPEGDPVVFVDHRGGEGAIDGAIVDADGVLWNARWDAGCVDAYAPDGNRIRTIDVPARKPTCPAFVGQDCGRMIVTSAWQGMDKDTRALDPQAGKTFLLDFAVNGRHEPRVCIN